MTEGLEAFPTPSALPADPQISEKTRRSWNRQESVQKVMDFEMAAAQGTSQRQFAEPNAVPRTTLQYGHKRKHNLDCAPEIIAFFESPVGLALLHRLVIAIQFVMCTVCGNGVRPCMRVLDLAGLSPFVANSFGTRRKLRAQMESAIIAFAEGQFADLSKQMAPKRITVCEDETFHPETCLVAIEPVSNFILLEAYANGRDATTWTTALKEALGDLPVRIIQSTSDEGKGLLSHVRTGLGAHHSPDLFHVQYELSRATSVALAGQVRRAEQAVTEATTQVEVQREEAQAQIAKDEAEQSLKIAAARQETAHRAIRGIGKAYHPVDLTTGALRSAAQVTTVLEQHFGEIAAVAKEASLPERCLKGIEKAHRLVPALAATVTFFHREVEERIRALDLTCEQAHVVQQHLIPAAYLNRATRKATPADTRAPLVDLAERLWADAPTAFANFAPERRAMIDHTVQECADLFQRSSSCVEGRNGQLSLRHHSLHSISAARLEALTAVHNYFIERPDHTTAAERFFGKKPAPLFDWLLDHLDVPVRPAMKRASIPTSATPPLLN